MEETPCDECGCLGNHKDKDGNPCGYDADNCALDECLVCPCCNKKGAGNYIKEVL
jgi:hypothetical protein